MCEPERVSDKDFGVWGWGGGTHLRTQTNKRVEKTMMGTIIKPEVTI